MKLLIEDVSDYKQDYVDDLRTTAVLLKNANATNIKLENGVLKIPIYDGEYYIFLDQIPEEILFKSMASNKKRG